MQVAISIILCSLVAFLAVRWVYFKILKIANKKSLLDSPDPRKLQKRPVPILGGIAVFFGLVAGILAGMSVDWLLTGSLYQSLTPIICAMMLMIYIGAVDDLIGLTPTTRFIAETVTVLAVIFAGGGCIDSFHGLWGINGLSWWIAVPLTVFAGVGIINAINMIDGVNGLCSGLSIISCAFFGYAFLKVGEISNAVLAFSTIAALIPFFFHNVFGQKSRMFLGDAGTMMIGILMVWFTINILRGDSSVRMLMVQRKVNMIAMVLAILSVPVFDTVRVMTQRIYHGKNPFHPDRTHLHHVFIRAGVSHSITTLSEFFINFLIVGIWALSVKLHASLDMQFYIVVLSSVILVWGLYFFLSRHERKHTEFMHRLAKFGVKSHLGHTETWLRIENLLDAPAIEDTDGEGDTEPFDEGEDAVERTLFYEFLKGKSEVFVDDIKRRSGVNPDHVDRLVDDGIREGSVIKVKGGLYGMPSIITLKEE